MENPIKIIVDGAAGRMGSLLTELAQAEPDFILAGAVDVKDRLSALSSLPCAVTDNVENALAAFPDAILIDFTSAEGALTAAQKAAKLKNKMVIGATGIGAAQKEQLQKYARETAILWSANMSIGVNALLGLLPQLAAKLGIHYDMEIMELHHKRKKDAPSGTALMLAEALAGARNWDMDKTRISARDGIIGPRQDNEIGVQALRGGDVVGIHSVYFLGPGEFIEVTHQAESRENFAQGALRCAKWLAAKTPGKLYSMQDVLEDAS